MPIAWLRNIDERDRVIIWQFGGIDGYKLPNKGRGETEYYSFSGVKTEKGTFATP